MIVLGSVHLTAADGPGDRFIIGESQAGEQVRFISLKGPKDFSFMDFGLLILDFCHCCNGNLREGLDRLSKR